MEKTRIVKQGLKFSLFILLLYWINKFTILTISNFVLFVFLPVGPLIIAIVCVSTVVKFIEGDLTLLQAFIFAFALPLTVYFVDQYFNYLFTDTDLAFFDWYIHVIENRSASIGIRGKQSASGVNSNWNYFQELIKLITVTYTFYVFIYDRIRKKFGYA